MEKSAFTRTCLSRIKVIMVIMCILLIELLYQTMMGQLLVLEYLMSGVCGCLWLSLVVPGIECRCFLITWFRWCLFDAENPRVWLPGARVHPELGR
jgi:hypothetical protein